MRMAIGCRGDRPPEARRVSSSERAAQAPHGSGYVDALHNHKGLKDPISRKRVAAMDIDDLTTAPRVR